MRLFALSDLHVDYSTNADWVRQLSMSEYREDVLILAGDVSDKLSLLRWCLSELVARFRAVLYVPGNHELWVCREEPQLDSYRKFQAVRSLAVECGAVMQAFHTNDIAVVPLLAWYDYTFGRPSDELRAVWMDYRRCIWPAGQRDEDITACFLGMNDLTVQLAARNVITFSHFVPRIDLLPAAIPPAKRLLYPVLGTSRLDACLRSLNSTLHVYGHSHVNRSVQLSGVRYVNNAFGYPGETAIAAKTLRCIYPAC